MTEFSQEDRYYWAACAGIDGIGFRTFERILAFKQKHNLSWLELWQSLATADGLQLTLAQRTKATEFQQKYTPVSYFDWLQDHGIRVLATPDKEYPKLLQQTDGAPFVLFTKGEWQWGKIPVAVVGTRKATGYGKLVTSKITKELVSVGATIISGFMYGVDTLAHQAALEGGGHTIGVLGFGFEHCFPKSHQPLMDRYLEQGMTFVTEFAPHVPPYAGNFPARNRIVAGLSLATVVTEAAAESGSLITAQLALNYDRLVCAVPGAITNPYCEGTKWLINQGATLISSGFEVVEELRDQLEEGVVSHLEVEESVPVQVFTNQLQEQLYHSLGSRSATITELSQELASSVPEVTVELSVMELAGLVAREGEKWVLL